MAESAPVTVSADEFLAMGRRFWPSSLSVLLGAELSALAPGRVTLELPLRDVLKQQHGFAHGAS